jgi:hypothetical protein
MKKIVNRSTYDEELAFIPDILGPLMQGVYDDLKRQIPKGFVFLRFEEVPETVGRWSDQIRVTTTLHAVRAPRFMYNRYLRLKKSTRNLVQ